MSSSSLILFSSFWLSSRKEWNSTYFLALESLGYGDFRKEAEDVMNECRDVAAKRRRQSTRLENLGIPEEELLRQQQELFAKARAAAAEQDLLQQQQLQQQQQQEQQGSTPSTSTSAGPSS